MVDKLTIVVVDQDEAVRTELIALLKKIGRISAAYVEGDSAGEAIELCKRHNPEIVFLGVSGDGDKGVNTVRALCKEDPQLIVAVVTDVNDHQLILEYIQTGATDFLRKQCTSEDVQNLMTRFLGDIRRRQHRLFRSDTLSVAKVNLSLESDARAVAPAVNVFSSVVRGFVPGRELMRLELGLEEMIRNAFEHGNLGITGEEKTETTENGTFDELVEERGKAARAAGKQVAIQYTLEDGEVVVEIHDEGPGFDWQKMLAAAADPTALLLLHGRGLIYARQVFDDITYNEAGNQVTLRKKFAD